MIRTTRPEWLEPHIDETLTLEFRGEWYEYHVVRSQFGVDQGVTEIFTSGRDGLLAVSDAYPMEYRYLGLVHEVIEWVINAADQSEWACLNALKEELGLAEQMGLEMTAYIAFRTKFFEVVVAYYDARKDQNEISRFLFVRLTHSLNYLRTLAPK